MEPVRSQCDARAVTSSIEAFQKHPLGCLLAVRVHAARKEAIVGQHRGPGSDVQAQMLKSPASESLPQGLQHGSYGSP